MEAYNTMPGECKLNTRLAFQNSKTTIYRPHTLYDTMTSFTTSTKILQGVPFFSNYGFYHLNLAGITKFKYEKKNEKDSGRSGKMKPSCKWPIRVHVASSLCFKARLSAKTLIWKWFFILMQIKLIFTRKVSQLASFWKRVFLELGNGLLLFHWTNFEKYNYDLLHFTLNQVK